MPHLPHTSYHDVTKTFTVIPLHPMHFYVCPVRVLHVPICALVTNTFIGSFLFVRVTSLLLLCRYLHLVQLTTPPPRRWSAAVAAVAVELHVTVHTNWQSQCRLCRQRCCANAAGHRLV